ncbi:hypothetical protein MKEN_01274600 [Mycena kentingensis (nom. inval.)]|nr:hypothetical protein MKEN_01274600 [Mycena kentingensis (nom. inval.)]
MGGGPGFYSTPQRRALASASMAVAGDLLAPPTLERVRPIALPSQLPGVDTAILHPLLARDTCIRISLAAAVASKRRVSSDMDMDLDANAPATSPGLPSMTVVCKGLPWVITAHAAGSGGVTVREVLDAIRDAFGMDVDQMQFDDWRHDMTKGRQAVDAGFTLAAYRPGMTRADLLAGRTKFAGLVSSADIGGDVWTLELED